MYYLKGLIWDHNNQRGRSQTTLTSFGVVWPPNPPRWHFLPLQHFWTTYLSPLVNVVCEWHESPYPFGGWCNYSHYMNVWIQRLCRLLENDFICLLGTENFHLYIGSLWHQSWKKGSYALLALGRLDGPTAMFYHEYTMGSKKLWNRNFLNVN